MYRERKKNILVGSDREAIELCEKALNFPDDEYLKLVESCSPEEDLYKMLTGDEAPMIHVNLKSAEPSEFELVYQTAFREKYLNSKGENF